MNTDKLYEQVKVLRKYVTELVKLDAKDANKLDASDWQDCLSDIAIVLILFETYIKDCKGE